MLGRKKGGLVHAMQSNGPHSQVGIELLHIAEFHTQLVTEQAKGGVGICRGTQPWEGGGDRSLLNK